VGVIRSRSLCCVWPVFYLGTFGRQGVLQRTFAFPVAGFGGPKLTWLRRPKGLISKSIRRLARRPGAGSYHRVGGGQVGPIPPPSPRPCAMLCFPSPFSSKGGSHASFVDRGLTTGIPTGCSRPPYLNRSSYRSLSPIAGWKGSASEPYVKLPPHTAPPRIGDIGSVRRSNMAGSACVGSFRLLHAPPSPRDTRERVSFSVFPLVTLGKGFSYL